MTNPSSGNSCADLVSSFSTMPSKTLLIPGRALCLSALQCIADHHRPSEFTHQF